MSLWLEEYEVDRGVGDEGVGAYILDAEGDTDR